MNNDQTNLNLAMIAAKYIRSTPSLLFPASTITWTRSSPITPSPEPCSLLFPIFCLTFGMSVGVNPMIWIQTTDFTDPTVVSICCLQWCLFKGQPSSDKCPQLSWRHLALPPSLVKHMRRKTLWLNPCEFSMTIYLNIYLMFWRYKWLAIASIKMLRAFASENKP